MRIKRILPIVLLCFECRASAQSLTTVGIPTEAFNYVASLQQGRDWCWAASSQMILNWFDVDVRQGDVVRKIRGGAFDQSASAKEISAALNRVATCRSGKRAVIHTMSAAGPPNPLLMIKQLSQQMPMLLAVDTGPQRGHAVVLTACRYYKDRRGTHIVSMVIRDPYPTPDNVRNGGRLEISGPALRDFVNFISRTWMVWVTEH